MGVLFVNVLKYQFKKKRKKNNLQNIVSFWRGEGAEKFTNIVERRLQINRSN